MVRSRGKDEERPRFWWWAALTKNVYPLRKLSQGNTPYQGHFLTAVDAPRIQLAMVFTSDTTGLTTVSGCFRDERFGGKPASRILYNNAR